MPYLNWIDDAVLTTEVNRLLAKATDAEEKVKTKFNQNVIDPFSALFVMSGFHLDYAQWYKMESTRQAQKTLQNHIGDFHQNILGAVDGWENLKTGNVIDLVCEERKIIAEVKNKYNTVSGGKLADLYNTLEQQVMPKSSKYKDFTAYYVAIIPQRKKRYNKMFTPSDKSKGEKCRDNKFIRAIDGASFYELVTGDANALVDLYTVLPTVIADVSKRSFTPSDLEKLKKFFDDAFE